MKKTILIKLASVDITIEEDASQMLSNYLDDIESRLMPYEVQDVMTDIEARIADLFCQQLSPNNQVVSIAMVRSMIDTIGDPSNFGRRRYSDRTGGSTTSNYPKRLYRLRTDRAIGGVCSGIAEYFGIEPAPIRLATFLLVFFGGLSLWVYVILWIVLPLEPISPRRSNNYASEQNKTRR